MCFSFIFRLFVKMNLKFLKMNVWRWILMGVFLLGTSLSLQAQSYERKWKKVEELEKKDLPKSVIEEAKTIYLKAEKEKNVPQMMKAFLTMTVYREIVSPDSLQVDIKKLEAWASSPKTSVQERAVLFSILGEMVIRKDFEKGDSCLKQSLKDSMALIKYDAGKFVPLVKVGETSRRYFNDNLYDLLARRAILLWKQNLWQPSKYEIDESIKQTYKSLLSYYKREDNRSAWLLTALDAYPKADERQLRAWISEYGDQEVCAEVYCRLVDLMRGDDRLSEALALTREGIARYPHYERINVLKMREEHMTSPRIYLSVENAYPNEPLKMRVNSRNLKEFTLSLYKVHLNAESSLLTELTPEMMDQHGTLLRQQSFSLPEAPEYQSVTTWFPVVAPEAGIYYWVAQPDGYKDLKGGTLMRLTSMLLVERGLPVDRQELIVLDKKSGHPVPHADVAIYKKQDGEFMRVENYKANDEGVVMLTGRGDESVYCQAYTSTDKAMPIHWVRFARNRHFTSSKQVEYVRLFTDRALYRPGQRVCYSGIAYSRLKDSLSVSSKGEYSVVLLDANRREVAKQKVNSDDFGTFQGTFELPEETMSGTYYIQTDKGLVTIQVEEYKRPTFKVEFDTIRSVYGIGDSLRVIGFARNFSDVPVQGAKVSYQIAQLENSFGRIRGREIGRTDGETITDAQGRFEIPVYFSQVEEEGTFWFYNYEVSVDVTNVAGETQTGSLNLPVGSSSLQVFVPDWENKILVKEDGKMLNCRVVNLKGIPVEKEVSCQVYSVREGIKDNWEKGKCVWRGKVWSNKAFVPHELYQLPSGRYLLVVSVTDENGKEDEQEVMFTLFSSQDKQLPYETEIWCYQTGDEFDADGIATVYFGSKEKDVCLFYDVYTANGWIESKCLNFSDSLLTFRYKYKEEYGDGLCLSLMFAKNGNMYARYITLKKPKPEKRLQMKWATFRDRLYPGSKETWSLRVLHPDGKPVDAQLMTTLYDASLDQFSTHAWNLNLDFPRFVPNYHWTGNWRNELNWGVSFPFKHFPFHALSYTVLDLPSALVRNGLRMYKANATVMGRRPVMEMKYVPSDTEAAYIDEDYSVEMEEEASKEIDASVSYRSNFSETAFFYPQLRTNAQGEVQIEFTLPESLTQWKFMGLAHTKDMDYGQLNATVTASKDFMLQPNLPRFVRVGDDVTLMASLINLTQKKIKGTVRMELFNPETDEVVCVRKKAFKVDAEETNAVSFSFTVKEEFNVLACRMIAEGNGFSDGEQCYLPVLTNKKWITESVSLDVDTAGTYHFSLEKLFNHHSKTVTMPRMVVEFTGNPLWYAIQALPVLSEPENENVYSWAVAFYANTLAEHIVQVNPVIRQVVGSWKAKGDDVLQSALQKNEELKNLMLEETPWLKDALNDSEQKKLLVALFDENTMNYRGLSVIRKLKELQQEDGSWSWFKGMSGNRYMTTQITELLARLESVTGKVVANKDMASLYRKAFGYLKNEVQEEYERMCESERKGSQLVYPSKQALRYLYICALDESLQPDKQVNDYLVDKLENMSSILSIYGKSTAAIVLKHYGRTNKAGEFLQSVMEYSVMTPLLGRYFDSPKAEYSWFSYKIPTQVMAMEAVRCVANEEKTQEEMKRWLLRQKQTQCWETPIATVDAIYALLSTGKDWLDNDASADLVVGKEKWEVPEDALGYVMQQVEGDVVNIKDITVRKKTDGIAWGSVYAQFLEVMDNVSSQSNSLSVSRELYKDKNKVSTDELNIGDRITVRLTVTSGRDMDFVQLKDERAACMEPIDVLSAYHWQNGFGYYQVTKDASSSFFFDRLRKGTHILEYDVYVMSSGEYQEGVATVQSMYAPEYIGHSDAIKLKVK